MCIRLYRDIDIYIYIYREREMFVMMIIVMHTYYKICDAISQDPPESFARNIPSIIYSRRSFIMPDSLR